MTLITLVYGERQVTIDIDADIYDFPGFEAVLANEFGIGGNITVVWFDDDYNERNEVVSMMSLKGPLRASLKRVRLVVEAVEAKMDVKMEVKMDVKKEDELSLVSSLMKVCEVCGDCGACGACGACGTCSPKTQKNLKGVLNESTREKTGGDSRSPVIKVPSQNFGAESIKKTKTHA
jgi:hypothetical protein